MPRTISASYTSGITLTNTADNPVTVTSTGTVTPPSGNALYGGPGDGTNSWTIDNAGLIAGTNANGIQLGISYSHVSRAIVTNRSSGTITGGSIAVSINDTSQATVTNTGGEIAGGNYGVSVGGVGTVSNMSGGSIIDTSASGAYAAAVFIYGYGAAGNQPNVQVYNAGSLTGATGVEEYLGGSVTNATGGAIVGLTNFGVFLDGNGTLVNGGAISGATVGAELYEGGLVQNLVGATISGSTGIYFGLLGGTVTNAGTVIGTNGDAVNFSAYGAASYRLIVDPGAVFVGTVSGGAGVLELATGSSAGTLDGFGTSITNFSTLQFDPGADWKVSDSTSANGLGTMAITGFTAGDTIDLPGFAAVSETFSYNALTLTDSANVQAVLTFTDLSSISDFEFAHDGAGGIAIAGAGTGQTLSWIATGSHDWNTPGNWSSQTVPTNFDTAIIANAGSNSATIASGTSNLVASLTIAAPGDSLAIEGSLDVFGTAAINAGALIDSGTLSAAAIVDNALLAFIGNQTLDNTPLSLDGTLEVQNTGTLTLGPGETITQTGLSATIGSTALDSESIVNQGTIDAKSSGGSMAIVPLSFTNDGSIDATGETLTVGSGFWSNQNGTIANAASLVLDGSLTTGDIGSIISAGPITEAGLLDNSNATLAVGSSGTLGTVGLISGGTVSGGTIVDNNGDGFAFDGGTLDNVTYQGSLELVNKGDRVTIANGLTATVIDLIGAAATLDLAATQILDNVTLNIGSDAGDTLSADQGGTVTLGQNASIVGLGAFATLLAGKGTTLDLAGTLNASSGDTVTLADKGGTFSNDGSIVVNGGTIDLNTRLAGVGSGGTIDVGGGGVVNVSTAVAADQTLAFTDASGLLQLNDPASFAGTITNFELGSTIDLTNYIGTITSFANNVLMLHDASNAQVQLRIQGPFNPNEFVLTPDSGGTGTDITWTSAPGTFTWTGGTDDWNTPSAWDLGSVPTGLDSATIADAGTNTITISQAEAIANLTLGGSNDTVAIVATGFLQSQTIAINAGTLADTGGFAASQITDDGLLDIITNATQTLDITPLSLGGTLLVSSAFDSPGTLTLGPGEVVTQDGANALIASSGSDKNAVVNQGTVDAEFVDAEFISGRMTIAPLNFLNQGTIDATGETLTIGYDQNGTLGSWSNKGGTISNAASLVMDGSLTTGDIGLITGASGITEAGLLDNTGATLNVGTELGTPTLTSGGVVSGGTIVDGGGGFAFSGGTLSDVTYQGPLELMNPGEQAVISNGLTVTGTGGSSPGTIDLTGAGASLDFATTETLANVTVNIGNATTADVLRASFNGGSLVIGSNASIVSGDLGALATLNAGTGSTLDLLGTLDAIASGGTFTLASSGGTFTNDGTIVVGSGDTVDVNTAIVAGSGSGTIEVGTSGVVDVGSAVAAGQTLAFSDGSGLLQLADPATFAATITGIQNGATIDLTNFVAVGSSFANGVLTLTDASNAQVSLNIPGPFTTDEFHIASDGASGTDVTWSFVPRTFTWTDASADWNTPSAWDLGSVPTSGDNAVIGDADTNTITVGPSDTIGIIDLTVSGPNDTLAIDGTLSAGPVTVSAGSIVVAGSLAASQMTDDALLAFAGNHLLDNTPLSLGGTLAAQNPGTLTLGASETITQTTSPALLDSTTTGGETIVNDGSINATGGTSLAIVPLNFSNKGVISADNEALTIGHDSGGTLGAWSNNGGTIALSGGGSLVLDGALATGDIGTITGATGVTEQGLLDNTGATLDVGSGTQLGTVTLVNGGTISRGTIVDQGGGFAFSGGTLSDVTYQGPLELMNPGEQATISNGLTVTGTGGSSPGTIDLTGAGASLDFATTETLDNVTMNIGNATAADVLQASFNGGFLIIGSNASIVSADPGALATLTAGTGSTLDLLGTLDAIASGGTFTLASSGGTFTNDGTIVVGSGDRLNAATGISAGAAGGTIDLGTGGIADFAGTVAAAETLAFTDATGILQLHQPTGFAATIDGFATGNAIDLVGITADAAVWSPGTLTISDTGSPIATLLLSGDYSAAQFNVTDNAGGSTVTATCYAAGTRILTPRGEIAIEHLRVGDPVQTVSGRAQPIDWIGRRRVDFRRHPNRHRVLPVRIAAHAFGPGRPRRELLLSPDHAVFVEDVLIPIRHLINGTTVAQITRQAITYYHIELPRHDVLLANGMPAESYLEAGARDAFANGGGPVQLHPDFTPSHDHYAMLWEALGYAPLVVTGAALERAREALARHAHDYSRSHRSRGVSSRRSAPAA